MSINLSGSLVLTGSLAVTGEITMSGSIASASYAFNASYLNNSGSGEFVPTGSFNTFSSSILTYTGSANSRFSSIESTTGSLNAASASAITRISALETASGSAITRLSSIESKTGSYATTGSNTFVDAQYISQSSNPTGFTTTASLYTDGGLRVGRDAYVSGTLYLNNVTVYGTQSVCYITSSQLNIASNLISVNTATPSVRFGGLAVYDSGSTSLTGSILWDSQNNHWVYSNPSGSSYSGGMFISGPRTSTLGSETGTTSCMLLAGQGGDHLTSSMIYHSSTATCIPTPILGGSTACFAGQVCVGGELYINGASTLAGRVASVEIGVTKNGADTIGDGPWYRWTNAATDRQMLTQLNASNGLTTWAYNGSAWSSIYTLTNTGAATFSSSVTALSITGTNSVNTSGGMTIANDITWTNNTGYGLLAQDTVRFLAYTTAGGTSIGYGGAKTIIQGGGGNVGIGITSPCSYASQTLHVNSPSGASTSIKVTNTTTTTGVACGLDILQSNNDTYIYNRSVGHIELGTSGAARLTISSTGISCFACQVCAPSFRGGTLTTYSPGGGVNSATFYDRVGSVGAEVDQYGTLNTYSGIVNSNGIYSSGASGTALVFRAGAVEQFRVSATNMSVVGSITNLSALYVRASGNSDLPFINFSNADGVYNWGRVGGLLQGNGDGSLYFQTKTGGDLTTKLTICSTGAATFSSTIAATRAFLTNCSSAGVLTIANADSTNDAGVRSLAIITDRLRLGTSPVTSTYGAIATNGTNSGITFVTYDNSWAERARIECTGVTTFICQVCAASFIANGDFNIRNSVFSTTGTLNKVTWTNLYPSTYNVADIGVQLDGNYYNGAIVFRTADADNANVLVERMRMESRGSTCFSSMVCARDMRISAGVVSPMFMIERNSAYDDFTTGCYLSLNDPGTQGLNAKFHGQFAPLVNSGETMAWNYVRILIRMTSNGSSFDTGTACIRNATYFYNVGYTCFGNHVSVGNTMDGGRGFRWVVMPWFGYADLYGGTDVPGFALYNQCSSSPLRIGAVYLQYKT
jgi:hypothetical protein